MLFRQGALYLCQSVLTGSTILLILHCTSYWIYSFLLMVPVLGDRLVILLAFH